MALTIDSPAPPELLDAAPRGRRRRVPHRLAAGRDGLARAGRARRRGPARGSRRRADRGVRRRHADRREAARGGRLRARADRQVARPRLRRRLRAGARPRRPPRRQAAIAEASDAVARCASRRPDEVVARDRVRAGRGRAVPSRARSSATLLERDAAPARRRLDRRRLDRSHMAVARRRLELAARSPARRTVDLTSSVRWYDIRR